MNFPAFLIAPNISDDRDINYYGLGIEENNPTVPSGFLSQSSEISSESWSLSQNHWSLLNEFEQFATEVPELIEEVQQLPVEQHASYNNNGYNEEYAGNKFTLMEHTNHCNSNMPWKSHEKNWSAADNDVIPGDSVKKKRCVTFSSSVIIHEPTTTLTPQDNDGEELTDEIAELISNDYKRDHCIKEFIMNEDIQQNNSCPAANNSAKFKCHYCDKILNSSKELFHHKLKFCPCRHTCDTCEKQFRTKYLFLKHTSQAHQLTESCPICKINVSAKSIIEHVVVSHKLFKCPYCIDCFGDIERMKQHLACFHKKDMLKCHKCKYYCTFSYELQEHFLEVHGANMDLQGELKFQCEYCNVSPFKCYTHLWRHIKVSHHKVAGLTYKCYLCSGKFVLAKRLRLHLRKKHANVYKI